MQIDVSNGELVDKVSILAIKTEKIQDPAKLANVHKEHELLSGRMKEIGFTEETGEYRELVQVNSMLWDIENDIRAKESAQEFDEEFVELARSVYINNDTRSEIKRRINERTGSELFEEKEHPGYA